MTDLQKRWVEEYTVDFNATAAARRAGYQAPQQAAYRNRDTPELMAAVKERMEELKMSADEATLRQAQLARASMDDFYRVVEDDQGHVRTVFDLAGALQAGKGHLIKKIKWTKHGPHVELYNARKANETILEMHGALGAKGTEEDPKHVVVDLTGGDEGE
jgi:phage terminase small subunit